MNTRIYSNKVILPELSYTVMGILFKVHNELGPALLEKYYQRAVEKELESEKISFLREVPIALEYRGKNIGRYFLDFVVEGKVILELKANKYTDPKFFKQVLSYLKKTKLPLAILVNFRRERLEYRRIINAELKAAHSSEFE